MAEETEWIGVQEAARIAGFSAYTIREWLRDGKLPGQRIGGVGWQGGRWRVRRADLDAFLRGEPPQQRA